MKKLDDVREKDERKVIVKEQELQASYIEGLNKQLEGEGCDFKVINYGAVGFKGTRRDNEKAVRTIKLLVEGIQEEFGKYL